MLTCAEHYTNALRMTVGGQRSWHANPIGFAISWNLQFTPPLKANGSGLCMPISLEPGVGIQLNVPSAQGRRAV